MKDHFDKTYWYICGTTLIVLAYVCAVTFLDMPEKNQRFADIALAFLLGRLSSNDSYLTGGNPLQPKKPIDPTGQTLDMSITASTTDLPTSGKDQPYKAP